jgi:hypothetical protein
MRVQFNTIKNKLLYDNFYAGKNLFYNRCNYYYYSRIATFGRLFDILVLGLDLFKPELLQVNSTKIWGETTIKERKKIKIIQDCVFMGTRMIEERNEEFLNAEVKSKPPYMKCFYISQKSLDTFISDILMPLLKLVENVNDYNWKTISGKKGYWREYDETVGFKANQEIYIDPVNSKKMIKLS